jgi:hypothetical protein
MYYQPERKGFEAMQILEHPKDENFTSKLGIYVPKVVIEPPNFGHRSTKTRERP